MKRNRIISTLLFLITVATTYGQNNINHFSSDYFEQQHFAHRGGYASGTENTLETILQSISNGTNAIEVDVQLTKDNQLVLFHDHTIDRLLQSELNLSVSQLSLKELKEIPFKDTVNGNIQFVCSLDELIDTLSVLVFNRKKNDFILEVDFKPHGDKTKNGVNALIETLDKYLTSFGNDLYNNFFVSTFYPSVLKEINDRDSKIITAFSINNTPNKSKLKANLAILLAPKFIKKYNVDIIEPNICMVTHKFVDKWHKKGILISAYTANTICEKQYLENFKIAYTTNCPSGTCIPDISDEIGKPKKWCKTCN